MRYLLPVIQEQLIWLLLSQNLSQVVAADLKSQITQAVLKASTLVIRSLLDMLFLKRCISTICCLLQREESQQLTSSEFNAEDGPCAQALHQALEDIGVQRQPYYSGTFVGNHVHKCLQVQCSKNIHKNNTIRNHALFFRMTTFIRFVAALRRLCLSQFSMRLRNCPLCLTTYFICLLFVGKPIQHIADINRTTN